jgi:hypothetical protein
MIWVDSSDTGPQMRECGFISFIALRISEVSLDSWKSLESFENWPDSWSQLEPSL